MTEWYLWNDKLPDISPDNYSSAQKYFDALLYSQDRWSFIDNRDELLDYLQNGTYTGYGFSLKFDPDNNLRISQVYEPSPLQEEGITRGWKLTEINNKAVKSYSDNQLLQELDRPNNTFVFQYGTDNSTKLNLNKQTMSLNTVIYKNVFDLGDKKVAYLVFDSFLGVSKDELNEAFTDFQSLGANELILDMRYNGGGSTDVSNQLAAIITNNLYKDQIYSKITHNEDKTGENYTDPFKEQSIGLDLNRILIITTSATASASEMVINGLKPYMGDGNVILIGSKTHGKPVGMYVFEDEELNLAIVPISFSITNASDQGNYFGGIPVDYIITDDLTHDFGDPAEANLRVALDYIINDGFDPAIALKAGTAKGRELPLRGFKLLVGAF